MKLRIISFSKKKFSIFFLLLLITVLGAFFALIGNYRFHCLYEQRNLARLGLRVEAREYCGPNWLRPILGDLSDFHSVTSISICENRPDYETFSALSTCNNLEFLQIYPVQLENRVDPNLELFKGTFNDSDIKEIKLLKANKKLKFITVVGNCVLSGDCICHFTGLEINLLDLDALALDNETVSTLIDLPQLQVLTLTVCEINDQNLIRLMENPHLIELNLRDMPLSVTALDVMNIINNRDRCGSCSRQN